MRRKTAVVAFLKKPREFDIREVDDPALFAERLGLQPEPRQVELLRTRAWRVAVNCARQWGKSTMMAIVALHRAHFREDYLVVVLTPSARQSWLFVDKVKLWARKLGLQLKGDGQNEISLLFPNGSRVVGLPNSEDKIRGFSGVDLLIVDEAARVEDEVFLAVQPMTDMGGYGQEGGDVVVMSTPAGKRGFFYEAWVNGGEDWVRVRVPAGECARHTEKKMAMRRKEMGERMFRQEYGCEFLDTEDGAFREDWIAGAVREDVPVLGMAEPVGEYEVRERTRAVYVAVDLGDLHDHSAIAVVERVEMVWPGERDAATYELRTETHCRLRYLERVELEIGYEAIVRRVRDVTQLPGVNGKRVVVVVDASGVGRPVLEMMRRELDGLRLAPVTITSRGTSSASEAGWKTPRVELLESLGLMLEKGEVRIAAGLAGLGELQKELRNLKRRVKEGGVVRVDGERRKVHDDLAIAVALGFWQAVRGDKGIEGKGRIL